MFYNSLYFNHMKFNNSKFLKKNNLIFIFLFFLTLIFFDLFKVHNETKKINIKYNIKINANFLADISNYNYMLQKIHKFIYGNAKLKVDFLYFQILPVNSAFYYRFLKDHNTQSILRKDFLNELSVNRGTRHSQIILKVTLDEKITKKEFLDEFQKFTKLASKKILINNQNILKQNFQIISKIESNLKEELRLNEYLPISDIDKKMHRSVINTEIKILQLYKKQLLQKYKFNKGNIFAVDEANIIYEKKNLSINNLMFKIISYLYISIFFTLTVLLIKRND